MSFGGRSQQVMTKGTWLIIFFAMVMSIGMFGLVCFFITQSGHGRVVSASLGSMRPIVYGMAGICLMAGIARMLLGVMQMPSLPQFLTISITSLALTQACSIFGMLLFFLGAPLSEFLRFAGATVAVDLLLLLPAGLCYWASH